MPKEAPTLVPPHHSYLGHPLCWASQTQASIRVRGQRTTQPTALEYWGWKKHAKGSTAQYQHCFVHIISNPGHSWHWGPQPQPQAATRVRVREQRTTKSTALGILGLMLLANKYSLNYKH